MTRPLSQQVVVVTGASSGIGRETALQLARRGARITAVARGQHALKTLVAEVTRMGGEIHTVAGDVADPATADRAAAEAVERFGRIDTWVNNAAISIYATIEDLTVDEFRRVTEVNYLGQVHGVKAALPHLRAAGGGTIINVGSALSERAVPLQAAYCAAKHAIKGFTEALRVEMEREDSGINVVLIEPSSMNTPLFDHARSKAGRRPVPIPPIYEPRVTAKAILHAAEHPVAIIATGGASKLFTAVERLNPRLLDWWQLRNDSGVSDQLGDEPDDGSDNLEQPIETAGSVTGRFGRESKASSVYTDLFELHPNRKAAVGLAALAGVLLAVRRLGR
ncbi:MAG TPA: SDR family oxidoreductase [Candidatus Limnocylindrales bacterium]|nr:SDR family oxidoreductase [Candidatus Limnocylindrales bacterium]